jgi:hypothetical protein
MPFPVFISVLFSSKTEKTTYRIFCTKTGDMNSPDRFLVVVDIELYNC